MSFFLTFGATPTKATDAVSGYISSYTVKTDSVADWNSVPGTSISSNSIERNGKGVISFSAGRGTSSLETSFSVGSMPSVEFDITTLTFKFLLYVEDISSIKDQNGKFIGGELGFYGKKIYTVKTEGDNVGEVFAEEPVYYKWNLSDLNLKQGWNRLTLNFKTAETDSIVNDYTFDGISEFKIMMNKRDSSNLVIALDNAEVCVLSLMEDGQVVEPLTDTYTKKDLAIAGSLAAAVVGGLAVGCYIWAKKDEKRRLKERRAKALARKQSRKSDEQ